MIKNLKEFLYMVLRIQKLKNYCAKEIDITLSKMVDSGLIKNNEKDKGLMLTCRKYNNYINLKKV